MLFDFFYFGGVLTAVAEGLPIPPALPVPLAKNALLATDFGGSSGPLAAVSLPLNYF